MGASTFAQNYDATLVPVIFRPWAQELIRQSRPENGEDILDLACGTGAVTRELVISGLKPGSLTGADYNEGMLAVARAKAEEMGLIARWVEADAGNLPFEDDCFDVALCQQALQFFPDKVGALTELRRVLRPGGRTAFCVTTGLDENPLLKSQAAALDEYSGTEAGAAVRAICGLPDGDEIRGMFEEAGFSDIKVEKVSLDLSHPDGRAFAAGAMGGMHTGDKLTAVDAERQQKCFDAFLDGLGDGYDGLAIHFPHVANVITARA